MKSIKYNAVVQRIFCVVISPFNKFSPPIVWGVDKSTYLQLLTPRVVNWFSSVAGVFE